MRGLKGKHVLVTGGTSGIGRYFRQTLVTTGVALTSFTRWA
jgi:NAD(P)-dependent dehydrogenase (short-subunit alcohol dehydrogenase family)